jgi:alpha-glucosidase
VTRLGRADTAFSLQRRSYFHSLPVDLALGTRRARAAALLTLALPGSVYVYQGEELGLWEVQDIPADMRQDPIWRRSSGADPGRDGSRVPLPWEGTQPPFGFSPPGSGAASWLPQPCQWGELTVDAQSGQAGSMLELYRAALHVRRSEPALGDGPMTWLPAADGVLSFDRGSRVRCVVNLSPRAASLPEHAGLLLASGPLDGGLLPPDCAAWLRAPAVSGL